MNWLLQIPLEVRTAIVFALGIPLAALINRCIYRWAHFRRPIGPWSPPHPQAPPRRPIDYVPIVGWIALRRESHLHGRGYWIRPLLIELLWPAALAWLYWATVQQQLLPRVAPLPPNDPTLHLQFFTHSLLFGLMTIATFIDFDEQTIPDEVTVPGALLGLLLAGLAPASRLQMTDILFAGPRQLIMVHFASPLNWPESMETVRGLAIALGCFLAWCVSVLPLLFVITWGLRRWKSSRALGVFCALTKRDVHSKWIFAIAVVGSAAISALWWFGAATENWQSLFSALVGLFFGGALIWAVRLVAGWAMQQEAMGFGDVMLMAMIGAFLGWQATLMTFFLAPAAALIVALLQRVLTGRNDIAFGPYLCLAAAAVVVGWPFWWEDRNLRDLFHLGWMIPMIVVGCIALMGVMLWLLRLWRGLEDEEVEA